MNLTGNLQLKGVKVVAPLPPGENPTPPRTKEEEIQDLEGFVSRLQTNVIKSVGIISAFLVVGFFIGQKLSVTKHPVLEGIVFGVFASFLGIAIFGNPYQRWTVYNQHHDLLEKKKAQ